MVVRSAPPLAHALAAAVLAACAGAGCRAVGPSNLAAPPAAAASPAATMTARQLVAEHNENARRVTSLTAQPSISVRAGREGGGGLNGRMALERPRNFRLELLSTMRRKEADIGSNDQQFWFWIGRNKDEKAIYVCSYDPSGAAPSSLNFQPDWIIEALGLREIPAGEVVDLKARDANTLEMVHARKAAGGATVKKVSLIDRQHRLVREHIFYEPGGKQPIGRAYPSHYKQVALAGEGGGTVWLPQKVRLEWMPSQQEPLVMEVALSDTKLNAAIDPSLFARPEPSDLGRGVVVRDITHELADLASGPPQIRETLPAPPVGVRLDEPVPLRADGATPTPTDPAPLAPDLPGDPISPARADPGLRVRPPSPPPSPGQAALVLPDERAGGMLGGIAR